MKKIFLIYLIFSCFNTNIFSCDFCNCYIGLNPQYKKNYLGFRYESISSQGSHHDPAELFGLGLSNKDFHEMRSTYEMYGQLFLFPKLQLNFSLPYVIDKEYYDGEIPQSDLHAHHTNELSHLNLSEDEIHSGISDPLLLLHYEVLNNEATDSNKYSFRLLVGGGLKIPIGEWQLEDISHPEEQGHLPGTGSLGYLISVRYLSQFNRFGLNVNSNYMFAGENRQSYYFSNQINLNANLLYKLDFKSAIIYPNTGVYFESAGFDKIEDRTVVNSGGHVFYSNIGIDINYSNLSIHTSFQFPLEQNLNGNQPEFNNKLVAGIVFNFN